MWSGPEGLVLFALLRRSASPAAGAHQNGARDRIGMQRAECGGDPKTGTQREYGQTALRLGMLGVHRRGGCPLRQGSWPRGRLVVDSPWPGVSYARISTPFAAWRPRNTS